MDEKDRKDNLEEIQERNSDIVSLAKGYGCDAARLDDLDAIKRAATETWTKSKPTVLEIPVSSQVPPLI